MISDIKTLTGKDSYFKNQDNSMNLGALSPNSIAVTNSLEKNQQLNISGIQLLIEHTDLNQLMNLQVDAAKNLSPLFCISVKKEMFPGLFADPFSHCVHNIAGFLDFNEGTFINGKVMEIDGVPTIVSTGQEECVWTSKIYNFPKPIKIDAIAWELATSKLTPADSFHYHIKITLYDVYENTSYIEIGNDTNMLNAEEQRSRKNLNIADINVSKLKITFTAKVFEDSYIEESHLPLTFTEKIGRPLLRAINILEPVQSTYEINSLTELKGLCSDFHFFESPGPEIKKLIATIDVNAVLVYSPNQTRSDYEYMEIKVLYDRFTNFEARLIGFELIHVND